VLEKLEKKVLSLPVVLQPYVISPVRTPSEVSPPRTLEVCEASDAKKHAYSDMPQPPQPLSHQVGLERAAALALAP
jgi:hypothetical protein